MTITAITAACHRPEAWALCERYMARQTVKPDQWLVLDGDDPKTVCTMGQEYVFNADWVGRDNMPTKIIYALENNLIKGDAVVFWEYDDWYASNWIQTCIAGLKNYDMFGEGDALYYNVKHRFWSSAGNARHASLCQTAIRRSLFDGLFNVCQSKHPFFDTRLWQLNCRKWLFLPKDGRRKLIGIKAMPGRLGYSAEHAMKFPKEVRHDPSLFKLWQLIGDDAAAYLPFYEH